MANPKNDQEKVELYRAYSVEEILDRREMFTKINSLEISWYLKYDGY